MLEQCGVLVLCPHPRKHKHILGDLAACNPASFSSSKNLSAEVGDLLQVSEAARAPGLASSEGFLGAHQRLVLTMGDKGQSFVPSSPVQ